MTEPDDAPLDRTDEGVTKADLFDTAQWLDRRVAVVRDNVSQMAAGSGDITERIMGDLAGIRSEQIHLARRLDMLSAELRLDIRKELRRASEDKATLETPYSAGRRAGVLMTGLIVMFLMAMVILPGLALLPALGLGEWLPDWMRDRVPGQGP